MIYPSIRDQEEPTHTRFNAEVGQIVEKNCCLYWFASAKRARFSSVDLRPFSWSSGRIPSGTPSQRTVTLVPCSDFSNTHVMLISPRNSVLSVLKLTDCSIRLSRINLRNRTSTSSESFDVFPGIYVLALYTKDAFGTCLPHENQTSAYV